MSTTFDTYFRSKFWNFERNGNVKPRDMLLNSNKSFWFTCDVCEHPFISTLSNISSGSWCPYCANKKRCTEEIIKKCTFCWQKCFASHGKAEFWNYEKNGEILPCHVSLNSHTKFWFKCGKCNHAFQSSLTQVSTKNTWCPYCANQKRCELETIENCSLCFKKCFASHDKSKFWNLEKNNGIKALEISTSSDKKYWFRCDTCEHDFDMNIYDVVYKNLWCPFCSNRRRCDVNKITDCSSCYSKCFSSHEKAKFWNYEKNNGIKPLEVSLNSNKKFWFTCSICKHDFDSNLGNIVNGNWCPYCANTKRCDEVLIVNCSFCWSHSFASNEKAKFWNYEKNNPLKPINLALNSPKKFHFICNLCHKDFQASLNNISNRKSWCPHCKNKTESVVYGWLFDWYGDDVIPQATFPWALSNLNNNYKYDFFISTKRILVEVDGEQHFEQVGNWKSPDVTVENDVHKMKLALEHGITIIRIARLDVCKNPSESQLKLKTIIENTGRPKTVIYLSTDTTLYDKHREQMSI